MTAICATPFKLPFVRMTLLDSCGVPQTTATSMYVTSGIIQIAETNNFEDREEFFQKNGDGTFCVQASNPPVLKYKELEIQLCVYDPEMVNAMTGEPLLTDDATTPNTIGFRSRVGSAALNNFALEGWTRLTNKTNCSTGPQYGYVLYPWCIEGYVDDVTWGNSNIIMTIKCRTNNNSPWGTGPYNVQVSQAATLTTGQPQGLFSAVGSQDHRSWELAYLAPPSTSLCGGQPSTLTLPTITKVGLVATLTFPSPNAHLPAIINWGDGTADTTVTTGTTTTHTYAGNGTYNVTYNPTTEGSGPPWKGVLTLP